MLASGGTLASVIGIIESKDGSSGLTDQNQLVPEEVVSRVAPARISMPTVFYDYDFKHWQTYFFMSSSNEKMVKRSHGLAIEADGVGYGPEFQYRLGDLLLCCTHPLTRFKARLAHIRCSHFTKNVASPCQHQDSFRL